MSHQATAGTVDYCDQRFSFLLVLVLLLLPCRTQFILSIAQLEINPRQSSKTRNIYNETTTTKNSLPFNTLSLQAMDRVRVSNKHCSQYSPQIVWHGIYVHCFVQTLFTTRRWASSATYFLISEFVSLFSSSSVVVVVNINLSWMRCD